MVKSEANVTLEVQVCCIDRYTYAKWVIEPAIKQTNNQLEAADSPSFKAETSRQGIHGLEKLKHKARK